MGHDGVVDRTESEADCGDFMLAKAEKAMD